MDILCVTGEDKDAVKSQINHLFLYKERGSLLILSLTSSTDKCGAALVILAIALFSRSWFSLFRIIPQTASWYTGTLLTRVKKSCRERWPVHVQANEAAAAQQEVGAVVTSRSNSAAA